jgi:N-acyl-D-amino-acid deacylase
MDAIVDCNGRRAMFTIRLVKPPTTSPWFAKFDLTDAEFESTFEQNKTKKLRIAWHEVYVVKEETKHAAIWHFDAGYEPLTEKEALDAKVRPKPKPVGIVWSPNARIPADGQAIPQFAELESQTLAYMKANQMPALSVAVSMDGEVLYDRNFGLSDLEKRTNIKAGQPMRISGLSQLITVVAVMKLVEQGKLKLDQPVYPLLGLKPWKKVAVDARSKDITVLHLLRETAGHDSAQVQEPGLAPRNLAAAMKQKGLATPNQAIQYMMSQPLSFAPGEKNSSSFYGYFLLGRVIEKVSGETYEQFVLDNIAKPLGLHSLTMSRSDPELRTRIEVKNISRAGVWFSKLDGSDIGKWVQINDGGYHFGLLDASNGWMATAGDMLRLTSAIQASPSPILSDEAKVLLIAKPPHTIEREAIDKKAVANWRGCSVYCNKTPKGISFFRHTSSVSTSAGFVCHSSSSLSYCYIFNCTRTAAGEEPRRAYAPLLQKQMYKVRDMLQGK